MLGVVGKVAVKRPLTVLFRAIKLTTGFTLTFNSQSRARSGKIHLKIF